MDSHKIIALFLSNSVEESDALEPELILDNPDDQSWPDYYENDEFVEDLDEDPEYTLEVEHKKSFHQRKLGKTGLKCGMCNYIAVSKRGLAFHEKSHRSCEKCGELFSGPSSKREHASHVKKCMKTKPTCDMCLKVFEYPYLLKKHMQRRTHEMGLCAPVHF